ncbi:NAD(P)-dependent dehydrogenase (short-subunit alcohol dehydrogenase family) [Silvibacterium bohemicum]|uniref:NAD(P)-dependent dehydrogenase (Short-subunit alcohol dehydrogenase family) n=1 Tax=Silvibacterium bohemicum TaxID=1577686 RepID=A0A841K2M2_9BACT|nr:glucose 1-dehydrogenase [Silvibacterium bohemicum]MBB6144888.1 NAD(P)-dependent dehydrogenase (short-subunit alcohol dehydrogenase family) [Silvibacterium bohemicum]
MRLLNKVALITGGNSGIGFETAKLFIAEGARVTITGRNQTTLDAAAEELGPNALVLQADVSDLAATQRVVEATVERFGNLDVIFANAGTGAPTPVGAAEVEVFEEILKVNVTSTFFLVQAADPYLNPGASIIFNGSQMSLNGRPGFSAYAASKGALRAMSRVMASELSPRGIRVNVITTGSTDTPLWASVAHTPEEREALFEQVEKTIPLGRVNSAADVAKAVLFLASEESSFVQAAELVVDGGATGAPLGAPIYRPEPVLSEA